VRMLIRLLSCLVIASAAITIWTRAALVFVLGPELSTVCLWIAAGGSLCAVIALALMRTPRACARQASVIQSPSTTRVPSASDDRTTRPLR
jgi:hypothetical protein